MRFSIGGGLGPFRVTQQLRAPSGYRRSEAQKDRDAAERKEFFDDMAARRYDRLSDPQGLGDALINVWTAFWPGLVFALFGAVLDDFAWWLGLPFWVVVAFCVLHVVVRIVLVGVALWGLVTPSTRVDGLQALAHESHFGERRESEPINRSEAEHTTPQVVKIEDPNRGGPSLPLLLLLAAAVLVAASVGGTLWLTPDDASETAGNDKLQPTSMADWQKELATTGLEPSNPELLWNNIKSDTCTNDDYSLYVTLGRSSDYSLNQERIGIKHACPDRLDDWDEAVVNLGELTDRTDFLCETPLEQLSLDESDDGISDREEAMVVCDQYQGREWTKYYNEHFAP